MTSPNRPPSCDLLKPKLKECPYCGDTQPDTVGMHKVTTICRECNICGPEDDQHGHKWNSIPRRAEVAELLRLVDEACSGGQTTVDMARTQRELRNYARKISKEWKL